MISYEDLLKIFWKSHNPCARPYSRQYMSAVFYADAAQKEVAERTAKAAAADRGQEVKTAILPLETFYLAEDYHQKYVLRRHDDLTAEYARIYPELEDFVRSTAVTRLNAWLGGAGKRADLERDLDKLGLSAQGRQMLVELARRMR